MSTAPTTRSGGCECGAVRYEIRGPVRKVVFCHCKQCQRTSGFYVAATACAMEDLHLVHAPGLRWYKSSDIADRGFCEVCGSSIFYRAHHGRHMSIMAGTLDAPTGLNTREHIHVEDAGDYYSIADGLPQYPGEHDDLWEDNDA